LEARQLLPAVATAPQLYIAPLGAAAQVTVFPLVIKLREAGLKIESDLQGRSLKAQLKLADKIGAPLVGIVGDDELQNNQILIRKMATSQQELVPLDCESILNFMRTLI